MQRFGKHLPAIYLVHLMIEKKREPADKPGSVVDNHSSGVCVTAALKQPTRIQCGPHLQDPYLALLRVGFTMPLTVASSAVRSYRTLSPLPFYASIDLGGLLSAALAVGLRRPGVTWHSALWSPDFPRIFTINCIYTRLSSRLSGGSLTAGQEMARGFCQLVWRVTAGVCIFKHYLIVFFHSGF